MVGPVGNGCDRLVSLPDTGEPFRVMFWRAFSDAGQIALANRRVIRIAGNT